MKTSIIAVTNQKGGVGKTATSVNLAAAYAKMKKKVLLIDMDYQANSSAYLGVKALAKQKGKTLSAALYEDIAAADAIVPTAHANLDVLTGDMRLSSLAREKILEPGSAMILKHMLEDSWIEAYDVVIIDTHPSLDLLFQMAMTASHYYLVPLFAEADPFDGLEYMFAEIGRIKSGLNRNLFFLGLVITKFNKQNTTHRKFLGLLESFCAEYSIKICGCIPDSQAVASSSSLRTPLLWYNPRLPVAAAYSKLAKQIAPQLKGPQHERKQKTPKSLKTPDAIHQLFHDADSLTAEVFQ